MECVGLVAEVVHDREPPKTISAPQIRGKACKEENMKSKASMHTTSGDDSPIGSQTDVAAFQVERCQ